MFGYDNFEECTNDREAEYIDKGSYPLSAMSRAYAYCDKKFPTLPPRYIKTSEISGKWGTYNSYFSNNKNRYKMVLDKPFVKISFIAKMKNGETQIFKDISTTAFSRNSVEFETPSPTTEIGITEALININHEKREGDE